MVKRQKEKQYQSAREHQQNSQIRSGSGTIGSTVQRRLPFHCCALTLNPFVDPVCTLSSGIVFDSAALTDFVLKHHKDPVTGNPLSTQDICSLHMDQDDEGRWQCPILTKPFSDHTKIIAIVHRTTKEAYVYSDEAYRELNVKPKNWFDLTTNQKFNPKQDVLILNDPNNDEFQKRRDIQSFWHITNGRQRQSTTSHHQNSNVRHSVTATRIMEQIQKQQQQATAKRQNESTTTSTTTSDKNKKLKIFSQDVTGVQYTSGKASGSFTSTFMDVSNDNTTREASQEEILQSQFRVMKSILREKGYVTMYTNLGNMVLELHCDIVPRTCTNFLGLCQKQRYNGTSFHRLISNFMIQGGKSTKEEEEGSIWGPNVSFVDEFDARLKHTGPGIVSMANAGPNTNKQQFFITFRSCPHLDRKHSVFGKVLDGMDVLETMKQQATDKKDRPIQPIIIHKIEVMVDPAQKAQEMEERRIQELNESRLQEAQKKANHAKGNIIGDNTTKSTITTTKTTSTTGKTTTSTVGGMVGKYLPKNRVQQQIETRKDPQNKDNDNENDDVSFPVLPAPSSNKKQKVPTKTTFGDFSGW